MNKNLTFLGEFGCQDHKRSKFDHWSGYLKNGMSCSLQIRYVGQQLQTRHKKLLVQICLSIHELTRRVKPRDLKFRMNFSFRLMWKQKTFRLDLYFFVCTSILKQSLGITISCEVRAGD